MSQPQPTTNQLRATANHVIFQFEQEIKRKAVGGSDGGIGHFVEKTDWGFTFESLSESADDSRWGIVHSTGPLADKEIQPGMKVLVAPLKWTNAYEYNGEKYWTTNDEWILAIDDDYV